MRTAGVLSIALVVTGATVTLASVRGGDPDRDALVQSDGSVASARTALTITLHTSGNRPARQRSYTLRCGPTGGTWPRSAGVCRRLRSRDYERALAPIGPETRDLVPITSTPLTVSGRADGRRVKLAIPAKGSSTRLARFKLLRKALGPRTFDREAARLRG